METEIVYEEWVLQKFRTSGPDRLVTNEARRQTRSFCFGERTALRLPAEQPPINTDVICVIGISEGGPGDSKELIQ